MTLVLERPRSADCPVPDAPGVTTDRCRVSTCTSAENWNRTPSVIGAIYDSFVAAMDAEAVLVVPPSVIVDVEGTTFIDFWDGQ